MHSGQLSCTSLLTEFSVRNGSESQLWRWCGDLGTAKLSQLLAEKTTRKFHLGIPWGRLWQDPDSSWFLHCDDWTSGRCRTESALVRELHWQRIWGFPEMGVPLVIIHFRRIFPSKPSSYWGTPIIGNPPIGNCGSCVFFLTQKIQQTGKPSWLVKTLKQS